LPILGRVLDLLWRAGHFYHKFLPNHPLHQSGIFLMVKNPLLEKNIIATKNERKRLTGWCFMRISAIFPWKSPH
jgi:hypothetical protein